MTAPSAAPAGAPSGPKRTRSNRWTVALAVALVAWTVALAVITSSSSLLSWHFFATGATGLVGADGLHLYANNPGYQIGPVAFLATVLLSPLGASGAKVVAAVLMSAAGPACLALLVPLLPARLRGPRVWWALFAIVPGWVVLSVRWGHLDDVLAMVFSVLALRCVLRRRAALAGLLVALAAASKPWAIEFAPLLLGVDRRVWKVAFGTLAAGLAATWGPFILAAPGTLQALTPSVLLAPGSGLYALGFRDATVPAWDRTVAFLAASAAATAAQLRGRWAGVLVVALAVRIALDPQDNAYYVGSVVIAAAVYDVFGTRWRGPWLTLVSTAVLWQPFTEDWNNRLATTTSYAHWWFSNPAIVGWIHLAWCVGTVALVLLGPRTDIGEARQVPVVV